MSRLMPRSLGAELAMLMLEGFNTMANDVVAEMERRGHEVIQPVHAFTLEAIDQGANTASELGRRLSVTKQAAAKTIAVLEQLEYVERDIDPADARRKRLQVTIRGSEAMAIGSAIFDEVRDRWATKIGIEQLGALEAHLALFTSTI